MILLPSDAEFDLKMMERTRATVLFANMTVKTTAREAKLIPIKMQVRWMFVLVAFSS